MSDRLSFTEFLNLRSSMAPHSTEMSEECWVGYMQVRLNRAIVTLNE